MQIENYSYKSSFNQSKNINSKGLLTSFFTKAPKIETLEKDVFVSTVATAKINASQLIKETLPPKTDPLYKIYQKIFGDMIKLERGNMNVDSFKSLKKFLYRSLESLPSCHTKDFITTTFDCIYNAEKDKMFTAWGLSGKVIGNNGEFLLNTCARLLILQANDGLKNNSIFVKQLTEDIELSKQIIQSINNKDWETANSLNKTPKSY